MGGRELVFAGEMPRNRAVVESSCDDYPHSQPMSMSLEGTKLSSDECPCLQTIIFGDIREYQKQN